MLLDTIDNGYLRMQIPKGRVFAEVSEEGSDMASAIELGGWLQRTCADKCAAEAHGVASRITVDDQLQCSLVRWYLRCQYYGG